MISAAWTCEKCKDICVESGLPQWRDSARCQTRFRETQNGLTMAGVAHGRDLVEESVEALGVSAAVLFELATPLRHRADKAVVASGLGIVNSNARLTHIITLA